VRHQIIVRIRVQKDGGLFLKR